MAARTPITVRNLYRSILGRVGDYRGNRIIVVSGTIVGFPEAPLNELGFRNLLYKSRGVGDDGRPALNVYVSTGASTSAFVPKESTLNPQRYLNSTFVNVQKDDGEVETCLHVIIASGTLPTNDCPQVGDGEYNLNDPSDVLLSLTMNDATEITLITNNEYELVEGQHYDYDVDEGYIVVYNVNYLEGEFPEATDGDAITLSVYFDVCDPVQVTITAVDDTDNS